MKNRIIFTIGHSTRPIEEFIAMLHSFNIAVLGDVRSVPKSRFNPQYNNGTLRNYLASEPIDYMPMKGLGGLRHAKKDSLNLGWRNASFRGYADYMGTKEFCLSLAKLEKIARKNTTVIMCAEALPWRCHRSLIADALLVHGWAVKHIMGRGKAFGHLPTEFLKIHGNTLTYLLPEV